jgi:uncharacterized UBP type Zn finger protein
LQYILDKITKAETMAKQPNPAKIFDFELEKRLKCLECQGVKYLTQQESQLNVMAPVDSKVPKDTPV